MSSLVKRIGISVGGFFVVLTALVVAAPLFVDLNQYKPEISQAVQDATGRELHISGDIDLSLFPWIGADIGAVSLGNAAGFDSNEFAHIERMVVKVRLLPLLKKEIEARAITIEGLRLNLEVAADGSNNWQDLAGNEQTATATAPSQTAASTPAANNTPSGAASGMAGIIIGGLNIQQAQIHYQDHANNQRYALKDVNIDTGALALGSAFDITLQAHISSSAPELQAQLKLQSRVLADISATQTHQLKDTQLDLNFDSPAFATRGQLQLNSDISLDLKQQRYQFHNMQLSGNIENADLPQGKAEFQLSANISSDLVANSASIQPLTLKAYQLTLNGEIQAQQLTTAPTFELTLASAAFNPRQLLQTLAIEIPETSKPTALTHAELKLRATGDMQHINISELQVQLDDSTLTGQLQATLSDTQTLPSLRYNFKLDQINADDYLTPATEDSTSVAATPASAGAAAASTLPTDTLRALDIDGSFIIGKLTVAGLNIDDIQTRLHAKDGQIKLSPLSAKLYQGSYQGDMQLDVRTDVATMHVNEALTNIHAGPLLKDLMGEERVSGTGNAAFKLSTQGLEPDAMMRTLNGSATLHLRDGAVQGFSLPQLIREAKAKIKKQPVPNDEVVNETEFAEMQASMTIRNGVIHNQDLSVKSPYIRLSGAGKVNLVQQNIDYMATGVVVKTATGQGGADIDQIKGLKLPVHIHGSFDKPVFDIQLDEILKQRVKDELNQRKAELKAKLKADAAAEKQKLEAEMARKKAELKAKTAAEQQRLKQQAQQREEELKNKAEEKLRDFLNR